MTAGHTPPASIGAGDGVTEHSQWNDQRLEELYHRLYAHFGPRHWWPAETPIEVVVGAILTQNTAWTNVEKAIANLRERVPIERDAILAMPLEELTQAIRPAGYYTTKSIRLKGLLEWLGADWEERLSHEDLDEVREALLQVPGVGPETADSILLYAAGRLTFVMDSYTRRILDRLGIAPENGAFPAPAWPERNQDSGRPGYERYRRFFMQNVPGEIALYNEFHAQLDGLGHHFCRKQPRCSICPVLDLCPTGRMAVGP